jgi:hypothetical protein
MTHPTSPRPSLFTKLGEALLDTLVDDVPDHVYEFVMKARGLFAARGSLYIRASIRLRGKPATPPSGSAMSRGKGSSVASEKWSCERATVERRGPRT